MAIMSFAFLLMTYNAAAQINTTVADTTILETETVKDSLPLNDLKSGFNNLFQTAMLGDGINPGKLNPMAVSFVQNYIKKNEKGFKEMKKWAAPYFNMMDEVLSAHGIPKELKYLAVIELVCDTMPYPGQALWGLGLLCLPLLVSMDYPYHARMMKDLIITKALMLLQDF